ncbi:MAG: hypothetical protein ABR507_02655 [Actinomycetota bacterium]
MGFAGEGVLATNASLANSYGFALDTLNSLLILTTTTISSAT